jgi:hypothetical protein
MAHPLRPWEPARQGCEHQEQEGAMALARVVSFDGVGQERVEEMKQRMDQGRPDAIPATEVILLYDAEAEAATVILFFDNEDDYNRADATLSAMPADETPGRRASVGKYEVAVRATA